MNPEELQFWMQEFPDLDKEEIIQLMEILNDTDEDGQEGQPAPDSIEDRKNHLVDIDDYTKYW